MTLPKDPMILLGFLNMKLRDGYASLREFCEEHDADLDELVKTLADVGYHFDEKTNQFR